MAGRVSVSRNRVTVKHIGMACRHVRELMAIGVTENLAIRTLELFVDVYAKMLHGGSATPHHVQQVPRAQWSLAAMELLERQPALKPRDHLRVEHGTPKRALARMVLALDASGQMTTEALEDLLKQMWKLAVITVEEDTALNRVARSAASDSPDDRWTLAGIRFAVDG